MTFPVLLRNPKLLKRRLVFFQIRSRVWVMLCVFHLAPKSAYRFSKLKNIPSKTHRIPKTTNPLDEFVFLPDFSTDIPELVSINIVMKGTSFDKSRLSELQGPTFLVNWWEKVDGDNIIYATGGWDNVPQYTDKGLFPVWSMDQVWFESDGTVRNHPQGPEIDQVFQDPRNKRITFYHQLNHANPSTGSGLSSVIALCKMAKEVNIYGWDHYLRDDIADSGYWRAILAMLAFDANWSQPDVVEMAMYGWHYAHQIGQLPHITNHGYLGQLGNHPRIIEKLEKVFYEG